jgi:hypothetical protein
MDAEQRKRVVAAIQTCRRKVEGLAEDDAWRDFLAAITGVRNLTAMTGPQLGKIIDALHARGAPRVAPAHGKPRIEGRECPRRYADSKQMRMIRGLWIELSKVPGGVRDPSEAALAAFIEGETEQMIGALSVVKANKVIEALKAWRTRVGAKAVADG